MAASPELYEVLAVGVVLLAIVVVVAFYLLRTFRLKRIEAMRGGADSPERSRDRAFNRLALARREADLLAAQGIDVDRARDLIRLSNQSLDGRAYDRAYELAQAAHETLVQARRSPPLPHATAPSSAGGPARPGDGGPPLRSSAVSPGSAAPAAGAPSGVPKNRAEAQFQLRLFQEDLEHARAAAPGGRVSPEAEELYTQGQAAFARADYAEAFRLALRGRRRVGGHLETLGGPAPASAGRPGPTANGAPDAELAAEAVAASDRCPSCGHPTVPGDAFCRGCGAARAPSSCPRCGASRTPTDTFCGKCGERYG